MTTDQIQQEIERTRGEIAGTLQAIEEKLSPRQLLDQAVDTMRELTSDGSHIGSFMRDNPIPLAIVGLGLGWLAFSSFTERRSARSEQAMGPGWDMPGSEADYTTAGGEVGSSGYGAEGAHGYGSMTGEGGIRGRAGEMAGTARQNIQRATEATRQRMSGWSRSATATAEDYRDRTWETFQDHPLTVGIVAALAGAAIGSVLPRIRFERQFMGGTMDDVVRQARETGNDLLDRAGKVAKSAMRTARKEGLEPAAEQIKEGAKDIGDQASNIVH